MSDEKIKSAYPTTTIDTITGKYTLKLNIKKEKPFFAMYCKIFSSRHKRSPSIFLRKNRMLFTYKNILAIA